MRKWAASSVDIAGFRCASVTSCQVGASYRSFADVPRGFRLEELTSFSWNSVESALPDLGDLDSADYCLVSRHDFGSLRSASQGSVLAPFLESYFVGEGRGDADAQESHSTEAGRGTDKNVPLLRAGDTGDTGLGVSSGKTKSLRHRFLTAAGNGSRSGSLSFEKTQAPKTICSPRKNKTLRRESQREIATARYLAKQIETHSLGADRLQSSQHRTDPHVAPQKAPSLDEIPYLHG